MNSAEMLATHSPNATELLLIRHGETPWNAVRRLQGHADIALNDAGKKQAQALANALKYEKLDAVLSSDLQRAIQTATAIKSAQNGLTHPLMSDAIFRERCYGGFEGELINELENKYPEAYRAWRNAEIDTPFPPDKNGNVGETVRQFQTRIQTGLYKLAQQAQEAGYQKIALVVHGGVLECAYRIALNQPLDTKRDYKILNASINRFSLQLQKNTPQLTLIKWGDVSHLATTLDEIH